MRMRLEKPFQTEASPTDPRRKRPSLSERPGQTPRAPVRERVLGDLNGDRDDALLFAASSVINEVSSSSYAGTPVVRSVRTERGTYTLNGRRVYGPDGIQPVVLVYSELAPLSQSVEARLGERFRLTRKEARVALLLADEHSNEQIANNLFISPHTARHHTQNVLAKLGVRSRMEVAAIIQPERLP